MKRIFTICLLTFFAWTSQAAVAPAAAVSDFSGQPEVAGLTPEMAQMGIDQFLSLTPKKYKELTGEKLSLGQTVKLKAAQKVIKRQMKSGAEPEFSKGLYVLLAILGVAWVAMGVMDDWEGSDWIVNLILYLLCYLPGLIHALTKMKKYY